MLLKTIDHPTAAKWLDKLDAIAPMNGVDKNSKSPTVKIKKKPTRLQIFLLVAFAIIFGILVISAMQTAQLQRQNIEAINQAYK